MSTFYDSLKKTFVVALETYARRVPAGGLVLDIGCGMGQLTDYVGDRFHRKAIGVDIDPSPLLVAASRCQDADLRSTFALFDGGTFPFADGSFDLAFAHEVIEHVPEDASFLTEVRRLLKPGGTLIVTTPNANLQPFSERAHPDHVRHYSPPELTNLLADCGFSVAEVFYRRHAVAACVDRVLLGLAGRTMGYSEVQPHMRQVCVARRASPTSALLRMYQLLVDPFVTWVEQTEFRLKKRREGPSLLVVCRNAQGGGR